MGEPMLLKIGQTVFPRDDSLVIIDRRLFPHQVEETVCLDYESVAQAIEVMAVQGAGDIAVTAGYGLWLAAREIENRGELTPDQVYAHMDKARQRLVTTRPTGFHIAILLKNIMAKTNWNQYPWSNQILSQIDTIIEKQDTRSRLTGEWAETLLRDGDVVLTHCFPGAGLLYMFIKARQNGKQVTAICTETRPYLQGARLTAWAVSELGIPVTLITDNMAAYCMSQGMVNKLITAADRIAMDGTVANKVGTLQLAIAAGYHSIPFYVLGYGGPDRNTKSAAEIPIELRDPEEVVSFNGVSITGAKVQGFYPAFDLTPANLVTAIVTDRGILSSSDVGSYWSNSAR
ncbi:MAG TPA: s-methyl-5-thioribose-1-phosphate isomerase [Syntrophomonadaceae bacterium]|nr:s-methyl-5-thioribose-1-phosphate isomerase [Syntrophomonadaceae bacterium]